ncbi:MAG: sensor histidine kinase [Acidobacteria bacterium]|nr:sensor histidine kinase [Acidobacteriota bacterium]
MRLKTWIVAALGLGSLVALIALSMLASSRRAQEIYVQLDDLNTHHRNVEATLRALRSDVNLSGIFVRDYLLDISRERAPEYREQLAAFRQNNMTSLADLKKLVGRDHEMATLQAMLEDYWQALDPLFDWTPAEKIVRSAGFLRRDVVPRRDAVLQLARQIEELNDANLTEQRAEVAQRHAALRSDLDRLRRQTVLLGLGVALIVVLRLRFLEHRSDAAEAEMRRLSQQVVNAQEEERKHLSRELHDHVAQVLTGLRMELGRLERAAGAGSAVSAAAAGCKQLVDELFSTVRNLALGLRPSMLDDFGLQAAIEWLVRDFMRRSSIDVELSVVGDVDALPDKYRTCVYRVIQEALTNCARHARAQSIAVSMAADATGLHVTVTDDGVGVDMSKRGRGFGLRGMQERVRELGGTVSLARRAADGGTVLTCHLPEPVAREGKGAALARLAG